MAIPRKREHLNGFMQVKCLLQEIARGSVETKRVAPEMVKL
ncbi:MAG: hypothetical protein ABS960_00450 [Solibacillus isronensis]